MELSYKRKINELHQHKLLWENQKNIIGSGLKEMRRSHELAFEQSEEVECPTCGAHYENSIAERFALIEDLDGLMAALTVAAEKIEDAKQKLESEKKGLDRIEDTIRKIDRILALRKEELAFRDVVSAEGRNEATRIFRERLAQLDEEVGTKQRMVDAQTALMNRAANDRSLRKSTVFFRIVSRNSTQSLMYILATLADFRYIRRFGPGEASCHGPCLLTIMLFLHTSASFSSSVFCPIVIDAPNQQGQDEEHMPAIMRFLVKEAPEGSQVVIAAENLFGLEGDEVDIIEVGEARNQVLRRDEFEDVMTAMRPFLGALM